MIKRETKKLFKFELNEQKSIFAKELIIKSVTISESVAMTLDKIAHRVKNTSVLVYKYLLGRNRTRLFLYDLINSFEEEHNILFSMIEFKEANDRRDKYLFHKHRISCLIRAKKRLVNLSQKNKFDTKDFLTEYITQKRFKQQYSLQPNS